MSQIRQGCSSGADKGEVVIGDSLDRVSLDRAIQGCDTLVIATSATPKINYLSLAWVLVNKVVGRSLRPTFSFPENGRPYQVRHKRLAKEKEKIAAA